MGVKLKDIVNEQPIDLKDLSGKVVCIDVLNTLYQFIARIRQPDGSPLRDHKGRMTSHLSGLFYRTINLLEEKIKPIYVFDGKPPMLKEKEIVRRKEIRKGAEEKWKEALRRGDLEEARKYAQAAGQITDEIIEQTKELLNFMGIPYIVALEEGEAQAAYIVKKGDAWAAASQDFDSLVFGSPILIRNLTISGKRKLPGRKEYMQVKPSVIHLSDVLEENQITRRELVLIAVLIGTDFNKGIKGVGPKTAIKLIKKYEGNIFEIYKAKNTNPPENLEEIIDLFMNPKVKKEYQIKWKQPKEEEIISFLCDEHDFSYKRVKKASKRLIETYNSLFAVTGLEKWL